MKAKFIAISLLLILSFPFLAAAEDKKEEWPSAGWTPFQFAIWKPVQLFDENRDVYGLRMSLFYGKNRDVYGLDLGVVFNEARNVTGIQIAYINSVYGDVTGIQVGGLNIVDDNMTGVQVGVATTTHGRLRGLQVGLVASANSVRGIQIALYENRGNSTANFHFDKSHYLGRSRNTEVVGMQIAGLQNRCYNLTGVQIVGSVNIAETVKGVQIGLLNIAETVKGVQIGAINYCERMVGIQIGVLNIIRYGTLPFFPLANASFSF